MSPWSRGAIGAVFLELDVGGGVVAGRAHGVGARSIKAGREAEVCLLEVKKIAKERRKSTYHKSHTASMMTWSMDSRAPLLCPLVAMVEKT